MFERIIAFSIRYKAIVGFLVAVMVGLGIWSMLQVPIDAVPDITNNQVQVVTTSPSLSPQEVERFITYPIEVTMANIKDVIEIRSISRYGLSVVTVVFRDRVPILDARQLVSEQIRLARGEIPEELGNPEMLPITTGLGEVFQYTLQVDRRYADRYDATELRTIQDWIVKRQLSGIPGIVEISSFGGFLRQYEVSADPVRLQSFGLTITDVHDAVARNNQSTGGSYIEKGPNAFYIRAEGLVNELPELEEIVLKTVDGVPVLLRQVAMVRFGSAQRYGAMTANGLGEAVGGITLMLKGANSSEVIRQVNERVDRVQESLPAGVRIVPYLDRSELVSRTIHTVAENLILGGLLVILVLVVLLGNMRSGLIVASVIPLSLLFAFIMMHLFGVSANLMSLGAIDFGIVIDGAVIIVESIMHNLYRKHRNKLFTAEEMDSVVTGSATSIYKSAGFGVIIILIVFIPIMTLTGIEGKTFKPMAQTFSFAILGAFLLSMTYVPMMSALTMKRNIVWKETLSDRFIKFLKLTYYPVLRLSLRFKYPILLSTAAVVVLSAVIYTRLGGEFLPTLEEGDLAMQMTIPPGSSLSQSVLQTTRAERILLDNFPEVEQVVSKIGTAEVPTDPMAVEDADIMIVMKDKKDWVSARTREELIEKMKEELSVITAATFEFTQPIQLRFNELMTGVKTDIAVKIYGEDIDELYHQANLAAGIIGGIQGASDVKVEQISGLPQYVVTYDRGKVARYGLNIVDLNTTLRTAFAGERAGVVFEGERRFDLVVRMDSVHRTDPGLSSLFVRAGTGETVPLSEMAEMNYVEGPMQIARDDTKRRVTIGINVRNRDVKSLVMEINRELSDKLELDPGYYITYGGQFENLENALKRLKIAVPIALVLILVLLFFTFNSVKYALLIFTAVPLSAVGGILALWIRGMPFSISAGVGFIALFGVAVLNGIVLISFYNDLKNEGVQNINYIIIKGACTRLRPVLMTAVTDILGFLPMAISVSAGAEVQRPLATVVIGGLITSTMLTLIILPILYSLVNRGMGPAPGGKPPLRLRPVRFGSSPEGSTGKGGSGKPVILLTLVIGIFLVIPAGRLSAQAGQLPLEPSLEEAGAAEGETAAVAAEADRVQPEAGFREISMEEALEIAFSNNLEIRNAGLELESARAGRSTVIDLEPAQFGYTYGQINTGADDRFLEVQQDLGSLLTHIQRAGHIRQQIEASQSGLMLTRAGLDRRVKTLYHYWVYTMGIRDISEQEHALYRRMLDVAAARFESGEISLLERSLIETRYAAVLNELSEAERMFTDAGNMLRQLIRVGDSIVPSARALEKYRISPGSPGDAPGLVERYYTDIYNLERKAFQLERSRFFPGLSAGYFNQSIDRVAGFSGFQVGVTFPLWFLPQEGRVRQARLKAEMAGNDLQMQIEKKNLQISSLKDQLDNYESQLAYYRETALNSASNLIRTATLQFEKQDIEYFELIQSISVALEIERAYLEQLMGHNRVAFELEYLMK